MDALLIAILLGILAPLLAFAGNAIVLRGRQTAAFKRIQSDPLIFEGAVLSRLELAGHPAPLFSLCYVDRIAKGLVVVRELSTKEKRTPQVRTFSGEEFESIHPTFVVGWHYVPSLDKILKDRQ